MGDNSKIEWTDASWNPVVGCTEVSTGCKNCYANTLHTMLTAPADSAEIVETATDDFC